MIPNIFLTGSTGFIGRNLLENLGHKYRFISPAQTELELTDSQAVDNFFCSHRIDIVIHAANIGGTKKTAHLTNIIETNLRIFTNLLKNHSHFQRLIYFGSGAEYDKSRPLKKVSETYFGQRIPTDAYGYYKYICSLITSSYPQVTNLRLFGVYGKYEDQNQRFISQAIIQALAHRPITINRNVYFDYLYINDLIRLVDYLLLHRPQHQFYNVGSGQRIALTTLARIVLKLTGEQSPVHITTPGLSHEYTCDTSRLTTEFPWLKFTPPQTGIANLISYYRA